MTPAGSAQEFHVVGSGRIVRRVDGMRCVAGILVGGTSSRMGRTKAVLPWRDGRTVIECIADAVLRSGSWIEELVLLGRCADLPPALADVRTLPDSRPGTGPMNGLVRLMEYAGRRWSLLLACDLPLLRPALLKRLCAAMREGSDAVAFQRLDQPANWHACCALYHPRLLPAAVAELETGRGRLQSLFHAARVTTIKTTPRHELLLTNLNTPGDYERLLDGLRT